MRTYIVQHKCQNENNPNIFSFVRIRTRHLLGADGCMYRCIGIPYTEAMKQQQQTIFECFHNGMEWIEFCVLHGQIGRSDAQWTVPAFFFFLLLLYFATETKTYCYRYCWCLLVVRSALLCGHCWLHKWERVAIRIYEQTNDTFQCVKFIHATREYHGIRNTNAQSCNCLAYNGMNIFTLIVGHATFDCCCLLARLLACFLACIIIIINTIRMYMVYAVRYTLVSWYPSRVSLVCDA